MSEIKPAKVMPVSIDIGERKIKIIQMKKSGFIVKAGELDLAERLQATPNDEYTAIVTKAIKSAAKSAKIGGGKDCVLVVGGPHTIVRRFLWPEMPHSGLQLNAETEIALYLPSSPDNFNISYRVLRSVSVGEQENPVVQLEVLVSAVNKSLVEALMKAAKQAGFKPKRIDINENARHKLLQTQWLWENDKRAVATFDDIVMQPSEFDPNKSFAILDIADELMNMTVFIDGMFYANRYFSELVTDEVSLSSEVVSIIEYIHYRERGSNINSILIFGDENVLPELPQRLKESLDISIYYPKKIMSSAFLAQNSKTIEIKLFMDAFGAALTPPGKYSADLDLRSPNKNEHMFSRVILPISVSVIIIIILMAVGIYKPYYDILKLETAIASMNTELQQYTVTQTDIALITNEIATMETTKAEIERFHNKYTPASQVLYAVYAALPTNNQIHSITIYDGMVRITASCAALSDISSFITELRKNQIFSDVSAQTALSSEIDDTVNINFEMTLMLTNSQRDVVP